MAKYSNKEKIVKAARQKEHSNLEGKTYKASRGFFRRNFQSQKGMA